MFHLFVLKYGFQTYTPPARWDLRHRPPSRKNVPGTETAPRAGGVYVLRAFEHGNFIHHHRTEKSYHAKFIGKSQEIQGIPVVYTAAAWTSAFNPQSFIYLPVYLSIYTRRGVIKKEMFPREKQKGRMVMTLGAISRQGL